jgi:hypothetical protein
MIRAPQPPGSPRRKLVFTSSLVAFSVIPGYAAYAPAKAAMRMLADTLREECLLYDIDVHCSFPANILSPGFENEEKTKPTITKKIEGSAGADKPDIVAKHLMNHLERGHKHITYEFEGTIIKVPHPMRVGDDDVEYDGGDDGTGYCFLRFFDWCVWDDWVSICARVMAKVDSGLQGRACEAGTSTLASIVLCRGIP